MDQGKSYKHGVKVRSGPEGFHRTRAAHAPLNEDVGRQETLS